MRINCNINRSNRNTHINNNMNGSSGIRININIIIRMSISAPHTAHAHPTRLTQNARLARDARWGVAPDSKDSWSVEHGFHGLRGPHWVARPALLAPWE